MAIDWTRGMSQEFRHCIVDPLSWEDAEQLDTVASAVLKYDDSLETLGHATLSVDNADMPEVLVRTYLVARQGRERQDVPLGTFLVQTPRREGDGRRVTSRCSCYSTLLEAREKYPSVGAFAPAGAAAEEYAAMILSAAIRAPFAPSDKRTLLRSPVVADPSQTSLEFAAKLLSIAGQHLTLDGLGRVGTAPDIAPGAAQPRWTFRDDEASIVKRDKLDVVDWYGVPNVVEVVWSGTGGAIVRSARNDDPESALSTVGRGREVFRRITDPALSSPTGDEVQAYAERELARLCAMERTVTIRHGWCDVRLGDCVRLDLSREGIHANGIVRSQTITCETGCECESTVAWTENLWG